MNLYLQASYEKPLDVTVEKMQVIMLLPGILDQILVIVIFKLSCLHFLQKAMCSMGSIILTIVASTITTMGSMLGDTFLYLNHSFVAT
jgi:hypothetical protein